MCQFCFIFVSSPILKLEVKYMEKKYDATHYIIMYLTGYAFFTYQVYSQLLFAFHGLSLIIPFCIAFLLMPLVIFYISKKINNQAKFEIKTNFVYTILTIIYLLLLAVITLNYASVMIHNYYYQSIQSYIIAFFLLIPIFYITIKDSRVYYSLAIILFFVYVFYKFLYISNHEVIDLYPLYNVLFIDKPWLIIILALTLVLEPIILLSNMEFIDKKKKVNTKFVLVIAIIIALLGCYTLIREAMEFGLLINTISFPYFESCKFLSIKSNFDSIDYFYLFSITIALFSRLPMLYLMLKDNLKLKNKGITTAFILTLIVFYYLHQRLEFYRTIIIPILMICVGILITLTIMSVFVKRRNKNDSF